MASIIGHSITGAVIFLHADNNPNKQHHAWFFWLIALAVFPDTEYLFLWLFGVQFDIRITHSVAFCSVLPTFTMAYLKFSANEDYKKLGIQAFGASYSHIVLDMLVGVSPLPLLWPLSDQLFKLPFGILPSAGRISLTNKYFYRNLIIEAGILLPLYSFTLMKDMIKKSQRRLFITVLHVLIFTPFFVWGIVLER